MSVKQFEGAKVRGCEGARVRLKNVATLLVAPLAWTLLSGTPADAQTYGGSATGASITVPTTGTTIRAATGTVPISGGGAEAALLVGDIPASATGGVAGLSAGVMHSAIVGLDATRAEASMADITLTVSSNTITADFIMAQATAACGPAAGGSSQLTHLVINGTAIVVTGSPNQTVTLPNGTAVINQQSSSLVGTSAAIDVYALHVTTTDPITQQQLADVILASADPQIDCSGGTPPSQQFTTGGGWINPLNTTKSNFGFVGGIEAPNVFRGHLLYYDHGINLRVASTQITNVVPGCSSQIEGDGQTDTGPVHFVVNVTDSGSSDTFSISLTGAGAPPAYSNSGSVLGGNIQAHGQSCQ